MPFKEIPQKMDFPAQERELIKFWAETDAFTKACSIHKNDPPWSFIDGPITANNPMGVSHGWGRTYKDLFQRFWSMRGHQLRYQNGFDCQGLWVEVEVEKEMGFKSKKDIETYGLELFVRRCKARVLRYAAVQTEQSIRLGYWMDWNDPATLRWLADQLMENPRAIITLDGPAGKVTDSVEQIVGRLGLPELGGSYFTFSNENNYMIWMFLKKCWEKGWVYRGADVMPWCPRCATGISQHEIVTDGYAEITHLGVTLKFPLLRTSDRGEVPEPNKTTEFLLVWTTTPWTLTSNVGAAVGPDLIYVKVKQGESIYYLSKGTLHMLHGDYQVLSELSGRDMEGWTYSGPFDELPAAQTVGGYSQLPELKFGVTTNAVQSHQVILWTEVGETEGTGIVHIAPGCGAEDFQLGRDNNLPLIAPLDEEGIFTEGFDWLSGMQVSDTPHEIIENLNQKGLLYHVADYKHRYPVCWRCGTQLVFRLVEEWFISMGEILDKPRDQITPEEKAKNLRYQIMDIVDQIRWVPSFGGDREMDWLLNMHDWMISKKRYWGLALPIWVCSACNYFEVIGDEIELEGRAVAGWDTFSGHTPHRPFIDAVKITCPKCKEMMERIPDVGNPWLDAGIVPFSTLQYRTDHEYWQKWYPAQLISESFPGQFRNWFYSLLAMATVLDSSPPFLNNFTYALCLAEDGRPMHKSWGNAIEFNLAADKMGVDVLRWLYCTQKPENDLLFGYKRGDEVRRTFLIPLWNVYSFFVTYANLDGWSPSRNPLDNLKPEDLENIYTNPLDRWILARLNQVISSVTKKLEDTDPQGSTIIIESFLDDLSNWYVRRSRRRFWKSEHDTDKNAAYSALYYLLVNLCRLLSPFTPFIAETIYQNLVRSFFTNTPESVHHTIWPDVDITIIDANLLEQMALARQIASLGLSARNSAAIKVRQPLSELLVYSVDNFKLNDDLIDIVTDEINVKILKYTNDVDQLVIVHLLPDNKLLGPRFGPKFPKVRSALAASDPWIVARQVQDGISIELTIDDQPVTLAPNEILIRTEPVEGLAVISEKNITVAVDITITPELRAEGQAREIVRRIQAMRKDADFNIADRITTYIQAEDELNNVIMNWCDYIKIETLSTLINSGEPPQDFFRQEHTLDGETITIGIDQNQKLR